MHQLDIIKHIEQSTETRLPLIEIEPKMNQGDLVGYSVDRQGNVIGLKLSGIDLK